MLYGYILLGIKSVASVSIPLNYAPKNRKRSRSKPISLDSSLDGTPALSLARPHSVLAGSD